ncbi:hypothetical protein NDU88_006114 [Pleurodeles waltl]|uniref:Uncharacterized protein n=1 Tax=Pleurodeles waltl TaxID=8319 RepID=A0AAV7WDR8_PLEWA|nr:hypothetical protein NDU88_006114 [Pleurodeles waltl]
MSVLGGLRQGDEAQGKVPEKCQRSHAVPWVLLLLLQHCKGSARQSEVKSALGAAEAAAPGVAVEPGRRGRWLFSSAPPAAY